MLWDLEYLAIPSKSSGLLTVNSTIPTGSAPAFWYFKIAVTGKNPSSSGFWVYLDNLSAVLTD